jgi:uncharacterized Ntn-hydrolase superfamily protein
MTFSILARDPETGAIGGAAATGSLCVGGWVLRGNLDAGMSASQGAAPSTFWGDDVLHHMRDGRDAKQAVAHITTRDEGREYRQLSALDPAGETAGFTGAKNKGTKGRLEFAGGIVAGNMLDGIEVLPAMVRGFATPDLAFDARLLAALVSARDAGGDYRGLLSAALLVLHPDRPPLTLRIDYHPDDPIGALGLLHQKATTGDYADWTRQVPVSTDRERVLE